MAGCNKYKQRKTCKKEISNELIPLAWQPTGWWDWCMPQDEKKKKRNRTIFD